MFILWQSQEPLPWHRGQLLCLHHTSHGPFPHIRRFGFRLNKIAVFDLKPQKAIFMTVGLSVLVPVSGLGRRGPSPMGETLETREEGEAWSSQRSHGLHAGQVHCTQPSSWPSPPYLEGLLDVFCLVSSCSNDHFLPKVLSSSARQREVAVSRAPPHRTIFMPPVPSLEWVCGFTDCWNNAD